MQRNFKVESVLLTQPDEQFERIAKQVVEDNRDLYKRLS